MIRNGSTRLVNIKNQDSVAKLLDMVPDIVDHFSKPKDSNVSDDEAVDIAFPEDDKADSEHVNPSATQN